MSATLPQRLLALVPRGRRLGATVAAIALTTGAVAVIAPEAAHGATTPVVVTVAGASYYGGAPAFVASTNVSGVNVTGVTCTTTTTNATISSTLTAGSYTIQASSCSGGTLSDPNYSIGSYKGSFYRIYKVGITVTANNASRAYGAANPAFTYTATGWVNGDTSALLSGAPAYSTTATSTSDVGTYPITISQGTLGSSSPNYYFAAFTAGTLTVGATPLTVTVAGSSFYGSAPAFGATTSVSGVTVTGVTCTTSTTSATFGTNLNAGSYTIDGTSCSGGTLSNPDYSIGSYKGSFYLVYKVGITVTANDASRAYGAADPAYSYTATGWVNGDTSALLSGAASFSTTATSTSDIGTYPITVSQGTLRSSSPNYYFAAFNPGTLTISAASVTVTVAGASTYGGDPVFAASTPVSGLTVTGVTCTGTTTGATFGPTLNAGSYTIDPTTCSGGTLSSSDYTIGGYKGTFYLLYKAALTVTASDRNRAYGHNNPAFSYTVTGFLNGDTSSVITGAPSITTTATATSDAGTYPITPALGTLKATNYYFTFVNGTLTVNPAAVTVTVTGANFYGSAPAYGASTPVSGLTVSGVTCTGATNGMTFSSTLTAGTYTIDGTTCSGGVLSSTNYVIGGYSGTFYIVYKDALTVTPVSTSRVYGAANPTFGYTVTGFVNGENSSVVSGAPAISTTATAGSGVGSYPLTAAAGTLAAANYYFTFASGSTLTVTPAVLTVTAQDASRAYGAADPAFAYSITGFVNGDTSSVVSGTPGSTSTDTPTSDPGMYAITPTLGTLSAANYTFAFVSGTLTVVKATPVLTAASAVSPPKVTLTYGSASTPIVGAQLTFTLGKTTTALICTNGVTGKDNLAPVTDSTGTTTCKPNTGQGVSLLLSGYTASFAGNVDFNAVSLMKPAL